MRPYANQQWSLGSPSNGAISQHHIAGLASILARTCLCCKDQRLAVTTSVIGPTTFRRCHTGAIRIICERKAVGGSPASVARRALVGRIFAEKASALSYYLP